MLDEPRDEPFGAAQTGPAGAHQSAPPTTPGLVERAPATSWPTVLGTLSIVIGSIGAVYYPASLALTHLMVRSHMVPAGTHTMTNRQGVLTIAFYTVLDVWLLAGGIGLVQRRPWGVRLTRSWAWVRIVSTLVLMAAWYGLQWQAITTPMRGQFGSGSASFMIVAIVIGAVFGLGWAMAWPIVCLAWLGRPRVRAEWATWNQGAHGDPR